MSWFDSVHDLVFALVPSVQIPVGPAQILIAVGLAGLLFSERRLFFRRAK